MPTFNRILVAVDGSKNSVRAANVAISVAKSTGASLFAISVIQNPVLTQVPVPGLAGTPGSIAEYMNEAKNAAEGFVGRVEAKAKTEGIKVRGEIIENVPSVVQAIIEYADEWKIDLIVVGTRGMGAFKKLILGSISSGLVSHADCSVLVVR